MPDKKRVLLLGAGNIGEAIAALLSSSGKYNVTVCDQDISLAQKVASFFPNCVSQSCNVTDTLSLRYLLKDHIAVLNALPFHLNQYVVSAAIGGGVHYFDLTEDVKSTETTRLNALNATSIVMPQCGLAPGFVSISAAYLASLFDSVESIKIRVGALPLYPSNRLKYYISWSIDGLINEYGNWCEIIRDGRREKVLPLEGHESLSIDGESFEAFNTSGGIGSLCETFENKVQNINYKSIRYHGHHALMVFLMEDLQLNHNRPLLKELLEKTIPSTNQDVCVIFVEVDGLIDNKLKQKSYVAKVYNQFIGQRHFSAIQVCTASSICAALDITLNGALGDRKGYLKNEDIPLPLFLDNEFGMRFPKIIIS
jgi:saccharopine dehydrogenase-like NADP-dependent oxidoreductase